LEIGNRFRGAIEVSAGTIRIFEAVQFLVRGGFDARPYNDEQLN
jgi:hypothetical protein